MEIIWIRIYVKKDAVGDATFEVFKNIDIGDLIGVTGEVFVTRTGETTIKVEDLVLLSKTLRPLPIVKEKEADLPWSHLYGSDHGGIGPEERCRSGGRSRSPRATRRPGDKYLRNL